jgi:cell division protein ZapA (FtsZ GTPase activity inhibitor)
MNTFRITILGTTFEIQSDDEDNKQLSKIYELFRGKVASIQSKIDSKNSLRIAILAGMLLADDCIKLKSDENFQGDEAERITLRLIDAIDTMLTETSDEVVHENHTLRQ